MTVSGPHVKLQTLRCHFREYIMLPPYQKCPTTCVYFVCVYWFLPNTQDCWQLKTIFVSNAVRLEGFMFNDNQLKWQCRWSEHHNFLLVQLLLMMFVKGALWVNITAPFSCNSKSQKFNNFKNWNMFTSMH